MKKQIEHCSEQKCPECNLKAYNKGRADMKKEILKVINKVCLSYCRNQNGMDYCKNCGLSRELIKDIK